MEYDIKTSKISEQLKKNDEYILFGVGRNLELYRRCLKNKINVAYAVDNNKNIQGTIIDGIRVESPEKLKNIKENQKILILTGSICSVREQLAKMNKVEYKDYFYIRDFIPAFFWEKENKVVLTDTSFLITFLCTLKCKYCSLRIPCSKGNKHRSIDELKLDLDLYFKSVDFVYNFKVMGGEPTMSPYLLELLEYIGQKYRSRIGDIKLVTNATVPLSSEVLKLIKETGIIVEVNDYSEFVNYNTTVDEYINKLKELDIEYVSYRTTKNDKWVYFGDPSKRISIEETVIRKQFYDCAYYSRGLVNGKLYYCTINAALAELKMIPIDGNDYLDLKKVKKTNEFFEFEMGNLKKGYCTLCEFCNGDYDVNQVLLPAGEQLGEECE